MRVGSLLTRRALRHFRRRVDYSEYGGAPLLGVAGVAIVGHGRSSAKAVRNAVAMAYRFAAAPFHRARRARHRGRRGAALVIAFIFPGQGSQKVGMGKALAEAFPICRETFAEADAALGEPLSRDHLRRPRGSADADREHAAGDSRGEHRGVPAARVARAVGRRSSPATASASTRRTSRPARSRSPTRCGIVRRRGRYMQEAVPVGEGAMAAILGLDADKVAQACAEAAEGEVVSAGEPERRRAGRDRRRARRGGARRRARQGARREARAAAAGERAVPLRADEAGRGAARARAARAGRCTIRACRSSPTWTPSRSGTAAAAIEALVRRCRRRSAGRRSSRALRRRASQRMLRWVRARC